MSIVAVAVATLVSAVASGPAAAATPTASWQASIGPAGTNGSATVQAYPSGAGSVSLRLARLKPSTSFAVTISSGTCRTAGTTILKLPPITTNAAGSATRTAKLTAAQVSKVGAVAGAKGSFVIRIGTGGPAKCGLFKAQAVPAYVAATTTVGSFPIDVTVTPTSVLVANASDWTISRIDPATSRVLSVAMLSLTGRCGVTAVAVGESAIWAAVNVVDDQDNVLPGSVVRVDPSSGEVTASVAVGRLPFDLAISPGAVWVANAMDGSVMRIDPATNQVTATVKPRGTLMAEALQATPWLGGIAYGFGSVWVTSEWNGDVARIDPATNQVSSTIATVGTAEGVAIGSDAVWVTNWGTTGKPDGQLSRLDPATNEVVATIPVGTNPGWAAFAGGYVWIAMRGEKSVVQVDAATNAVRMRIALARAPRGIAATDHAVWVTLPVPGSEDGPPPAGQVARINY